MTSTTIVALVMSSFLTATPPVRTEDGPLTRRGALGAVLEGVEGGVRVREVLAGSSAEAGGLMPQDLIKSLDGRPVAQVGALVRALRSTRAGTNVAFEVERSGKAVTSTFPLKEWPREAGTDAYRVEYGDVTSKAGRLRTITFVPQGAEARKKAPALLIMQGLSAATLDNSPPNAPIDRPVGMGVYRAIAAGLARAGLVVMSVDKAGCGDSEGDATALDFAGEREGYLMALKSLKARPDVDPDRVFLFGHSMGGVFAPLIARDVPVRGIAVYGTALKTWFEYVLENQRRQVTQAGGDLAELDRTIRLSERFHHEYLVGKRAPAAILEANPELRTVTALIGLDGDLVFGRHHTFFHQLADVNLAEAWDQVDADTDVLALWGEAEIVTAREDHEWLAALVDAKRSGRGRFQVVPESDHGFARHKSPRDAIAAGGAPAPFNPAIIEALRAWSQERAG